MITIGGHRTGLIVPATRPRTFTRYAEAKTLKSRNEILEILNDPSRKMGRDRWGTERIKNQGNRGACNGFAGATADEEARELRGLPFVALSGEGLYAQINGGRDQGSMLDDGMKALMETGVPPESMVPHEEYRWSRVSAEAKAACSRFRAFECYGVDTEDELVDGLASDFVGVVAVHASNAWSNLDSDGRCGTSNGMGNHAVAVDGLRWFDDEWNFDMPNSWDTRWGKNGRGWLTWQRHFLTSIKHHDFYLIRSTLDDPQGDNPPAPDGYESSPQPDPVATVLIEMGSSSSCGWCAKWKSEEWPLLDVLGWNLTEDKNASGSVPTFTITVGGRRQSMVGFTTAAKMQAIVAQMKSNQ